MDHCGKLLWRKWCCLLAAEAVVRAVRKVLSVPVRAPVSLRDPCWPIEKREDLSWDWILTSPWAVYLSFKPMVRIPDLRSWLLFSITGGPQGAQEILYFWWPPQKNRNWAIRRSLESAPVEETACKGRKGAHILVLLHFVLTHGAIRAQMKKENVSGSPSASFSSIVCQLSLSVGKR